MDSATVLGVGNQALALLGAQAVAQVDEGTDIAALLLRVAPTTLLGCLSVHPWRCTIVQQRLSRLADPPAHSFAHRYALPAGTLAVRRALVSSQPGAPGLADWRIVGEELHTDAPEVWAELQAEPPLIRWPAYLVAFAREALAADLALPVTGSGADAQLWHARAWGPPSAMGQGGLFAAARRADSQAAPAEPMRSFPLLNVRMGGW